MGGDASIPASFICRSCQDQGKASLVCSPAEVVSLEDITVEDTTGNSPVIGLMNS